MMKHEPGFLARNKIDLTTIVEAAEEHSVSVEPALPDASAAGPQF